MSGRPGERAGADYLGNALVEQKLAPRFDPLSAAIGDDVRRREGFRQRRGQEAACSNDIHGRPRSAHDLAFLRSEARGGDDLGFVKSLLVQFFAGMDHRCDRHAGTKQDGPTYLTSGGRVLCVTSFGKNQKKSLEKTYENIEKITFDRAYYRKDIGFDIVEKS